MRMWPVVACCAIISFPAFAEPSKSVLSAAEEQKAGYLKTLEQLVNLDSGSDDGPGLARTWAPPSKFARLRLLRARS